MTAVLSTTLFADPVTQVDAADLHIVGATDAADATARSVPQVTTVAGATFGENDAIAIASTVTIDGRQLTPGLWYWPVATTAGDVNALVQLSAGGIESLPVITAADGAFDLQSTDAPYKRIVAADATISNAPLGFTTGGDFLWEYHPGDTNVDGYWTIDVFAFFGGIEPTHWMSQRKANVNTAWFLAEGYYAGGIDSATAFASVPASAYPSGTMYFLEDTHEVVVFDRTRQNGYPTADPVTAGTFVVVAEPEQVNTQPWVADHDYTVGELATQNRLSDGKLTIFSWDDSAANAGTPTDGTSGATWDAAEEARWIEIGEAAVDIEILQSIEIDVRGYLSSWTQVNAVTLIDAAGNDYDSAKDWRISGDSAGLAVIGSFLGNQDLSHTAANSTRTVTLTYVGAATRRGLSAIRATHGHPGSTSGITRVKSAYFSGVTETFARTGGMTGIQTTTLTETFDFVTDPQVESSAAKNALVYPVASFTALAVNDAGTGTDGAVYKLPTVDALQITLPNSAEMNAAEGIWRVRISGDWAALSTQTTVLSFIDDTANGVEMGTGLPDDGNEWLDLVFDAANDQWIATSGGDVTLTQVIPTYTLHTEVPANIRLYLIDGTGASAEGLYRKETVGDAPNHIG